MFSWRADHGPATEEPRSPRLRVALPGRGGGRAGFTEGLPGRHPAVTRPGDTPPMMRANQRGSSAVGTPAARGAHGRVLVVEDEQDVAELIRYNLTREGYEVVVASNGADALKSARELLPEVILLDIMVPQLNGWEVCRRLKQEADTSAIPVIMVTGRVEEGDKVFEPRTVDVHGARLRAKFIAAKFPPPGVQTVPGVGNRFRAEKPVLYPKIHNTAGCAQNLPHTSGVRRGRKGSGLR